MKSARISLRTRLTLTFGALFLVTGAILEGVTYLVTSRAVTAEFEVLVGDQAGPVRVRRTDAGDQIADQVAEQRRVILNQVIQSSLLTLLALGVLAIVLGYLVAGRMVRPLQNMTATARRLSESNLHERIGHTGPHDEIKELADTFDGMLDRLHRAFDSQRRFIANASHELRTPLAINRTIIDVALAKPGTPEATKTLADKLLGTIDRHEQLVDGLLLLARSERGLQHRGSHVQLADLAAGAIEQLADITAKVGVTILPELGPAGVTGDPVLLERCVVNLVENAVKYNVPHGHVWVRTGEVNGQACVQVENTGPGVSPEQTEIIFEPFRRLRPDRVGSARGAGLGLSIVRAVVNAHHGTIQARSRNGGGLVITFQLPPASNGVAVATRAADVAKAPR